VRHPDGRGREREVRDDEAEVIRDAGEAIFASYHVHEHGDVLVPRVRALVLFAVDLQDHGRAYAHMPHVP
jgi:hypothetical protein